jgi:hypothetical protein
MARSTLRPIRPNPLIATFTLIDSAPEIVVADLLPAGANVQASQRLAFAESS